jgi:cytochrome c biogenesis protein CcdA
MLSENDIDKAMKTLNIIWITLLTGIAVYFALGYMLSGLPASANQETFDLLKNVFYAIALFSLIAAGLIRRLILMKKPPESMPAQQTSNPAVQRYTMATLLSLALSETPAICGLLMYIVGKNIRDLALLILVSAAAMIYYKPRRSELEALGRNTEDRA